MKANRLLPLFGILAIALIAAGIAIGGETPDVDDPIAKVRAFYVENDSDMTASSLLLMAAAAAFLAWSVQVRSRLFLSEGGSATRATLGLVGSVLFAVGATIFAGIGFALGDVPEKLDPAALQALNVLSSDLFPPLAVGTLLTLFGYGLAVLKTRAFPVWLGWVSVIGALFAFTPLWFVPFLALAVLIAVTSVMMAMRDEPARPAAPPLDA
jgi:hypothetical protein